VGDHCLRLRWVPALNRRAGRRRCSVGGGPARRHGHVLELRRGVCAGDRNHDIVLVDSATGNPAAALLRRSDDWQRRATPSGAPEATLNGLRKSATGTLLHQQHRGCRLEAVREASTCSRRSLGASYGTRVAQLYMRAIRRRFMQCSGRVTYPRQAIGPETRWRSARPDLS